VQSDGKPPFVTSNVRPASDAEDPHPYESGTVEETRVGGSLNFELVGVRTPAPERESHARTLVKENSAKREWLRAPAPAEPLEAPSPLRGRRGRGSRDDHRQVSGKRVPHPGLRRGRRNDSRPTAGQPPGPRSRGNEAHRRRAGSAGPPSGEQATESGRSVQTLPRSAPAGIGPRER
jgi:hypothetical protein